jgi:hypothetical protein
MASLLPSETSSLTAKEKRAQEASEHFLQRATTTQTSGFSKPSRNYALSKQKG